MKVHKCPAFREMRTPPFPPKPDRLAQRVNQLNSSWITANRGANSSQTRLSAGRFCPQSSPPLPLCPKGLFPFQLSNAPPMHPALRKNHAF